MALKNWKKKKGGEREERNGQNVTKGGLGASEKIASAQVEGKEGRKFCSYGGAKEERG